MTVAKTPFPPKKKTGSKSKLAFERSFLRELTHRCAKKTPKYALRKRRR